MQDRIDDHDDMMMLMVHTNSTTMSARYAVSKISLLALVIVYHVCKFKPSIGLPARLPVVRETMFSSNSSDTMSNKRNSLVVVVSRNNAAAASVNNTSRMPQWMNEYITWHQQQRKILTKRNWKQHKYFIQRCLATDNDCGGTSDRLRSLPWKLRMAAGMKRIFFIKWERPAKLEEFLVPPPTGGLDWRVPDWLENKLDFETSFQLLPLGIENATLSSSTIVSTISGFGFSGGALWYNNELEPNEPDFEDVFSSVWATLFQPSPPVQQLIDQSLQQLQFVPHQYNALHIRSQYQADESKVPDLIENATKCGLSFGTEQPLFVATDSVTATNKSLVYASKYTTHTKALQRAEDPPHLHRGRDYLARPNGEEKIDVEAQLYYSTFVDLYLLAMAKCLASGRGTFGLLANLIRDDKTCYISYFWNKTYSFPDQCRIEGIVATRRTTTSFVLRPKTVFSN